MSQIIYGTHSVTEALKHTPERVKRIFVDKRNPKKFDSIIQAAKDSQVPIERVSRRDLEKHCRSVNHQGVVCRVDDFGYTSVKDFLDRDIGENSVVVIADHLQDPQNLGGVLRAMGAFGADLLVLGKHRGATITPVVAKTSAGAVSVVPVARESSLPNAIVRLKEGGFWVYGLEPDTEGRFCDEKLSGKIAIVVGSEGRGISRLVKERCDTLCSLPQQGPIGSLNAAMALACALYEVQCQKVSK